ncbi:MAG: hypothetical protein K2G27_04140 [Duncaniella sp.]|nr:hypothetical protein [Duncaniella sp.]
MYYPLPIPPEDYYKISGVCRQYNALIRNPRKDGGGDVPGYEGRYMVWTPTGGEGDDTSWTNRKSADNQWIVERKSPENANSIFVNNAVHEVERRRITYWRENKRAPFSFVGVYEIDQTLTRMAGVRIYRRISDVMPALEII